MPLCEHKYSECGRRLADGHPGHDKAQHAAGKHLPKTVMQGSNPVQWSDCQLVKK